MSFEEVELEETPKNVRGSGLMYCTVSTSI